MTSEFISKRCGNITIQLTSSMAPQTPLFSPITKEVTGYRQNKMNYTRPLMYPVEVLQLDNKECLLLIRGHKPLKAYKIIPDEMSAFQNLEFIRIADYVPKWHAEEEKVKETSMQNSEMKDDVNNDEEDFLYANFESMTPNFGTNYTLKEDQQEDDKSSDIIEPEETVYDPDVYTEVSSDDILGE